MGKGDYKMINVNEEMIKNNIMRCHKEDYFVLKSNAYGFGLSRVASLLASLGYHKYAVLTLDEAITIRELDPSGTILLLGVLENDKIFLYEKYGITVSINDFKDLKSLYMHKLKIQIAVNTGMNRFGIRPTEVKEMVNLIRKTSLELMGIYSHNATNDLMHIMGQEEAFKYALRATTGLEAHFAATPLSHDSKYKICRIGKGMYQNALSVYGKIVKINHLEKDEYVGYDYAYKMPYDGYIGVIDLGYADGLVRHIDGFLVYINNRYYHMVGLACMNHSFVLLDNDNIKEGALVHFISPFNNQINYETFTGLSAYEIYLGFLKKY